MSDEPKDQSKPREIDLKTLGQIESQNLSQARQRAAFLRAEHEDAERALNVAIGRMQMLEEISQK